MKYEHSENNAVDLKEELNDDNDRSIIKEHDLYIENSELKNDLRIQRNINQNLNEIIKNQKNKENYLFL